MAKDHRESDSGGPVIRSSKKRSAMTGRFVEVTGARGHEDMAIVETRRLDAILEKSFRSERLVHPGKAAERVKAVMRCAAEEGLTLAKDGRIAGRVSADLIAAAKARTGLQSDTELVEFALANVALQDDFAQVFRDVKGTVDPDLDLGF